MYRCLDEVTMPVRTTEFRRTFDEALSYLFGVALNDDNRPLKW
jgi:hypothetical protein